MGGLDMQLYFSIPTSIDGMGIKYGKAFADPTGENQIGTVKSESSYDKRLGLNKVILTFVFNQEINVSSFTFGYAFAGNFWKSGIPVTSIPSECEKEFAFANGKGLMTMLSGPSPPTPVYKLDLEWVANDGMGPI